MKWYFTVYHDTQNSDCLQEEKCIHLFLYLLKKFAVLLKQRSIKEKTPINKIFTLSRAHGEVSEAEVGLSVPSTSDLINT